MKLESPIIFFNKEELQEAVNLGLKYKSLWLEGRYKFPMYQGMEHDMHSLFDEDGMPYIIEDINNCSAPLKLWKDVREHYISTYSYTEMTLEEVRKALGNPKLVIVEK